jgi:LysR family transcriptional regulator, low CO2-responsive transcriptional regulator
MPRMRDSILLNGLVNTGRLHRAAAAWPAVTFTQLRTLVAIARSGSVKAAALEMKVSQAAVSQAISGLRAEFDDELYVRDGGGVRLTSRGRQLAGISAEILGLAEHARLTTNDAQGAQKLLRIATTGTVAEYVIPAVIEAFARRRPNLEIEVAVDSPAAFRELLRLRRADLTVGPDPISELGIDCVPFLRYELIVVRGRHHAADVDQDLSAPGREPWLLGPNDTEPASEVGRFFRAGSMGIRDVRVFPSHAAAAAAAAAGRGVTLAVAHTIAAELDRGMLARVSAAGTPVRGMWYASILAGNQTPRAALALRNFVVTPEGTHAALAGAGIPPGRAHPPIHITLWSGIGPK